MTNVLLSLVRFLISLFKSRSALAFEVAALQHQIVILKKAQSGRKPTTLTECSGLSSEDSGRTGERLW